MTTRSTLLYGSLALLVGCGSSAEGPDAVDAAVDGAVDGPVVPTWPTGPIRPTRYRMPDPPAAPVPPCADGGGTVEAVTAYWGQTHLLPESSPFHAIAADRPLSIAVAVSGAGRAPAMTVTARLGADATTLCLVGPEALSAPTADLAITYRATLPARWVRPGLTLELDIAGQRRQLQPAVRPAVGMTLYIVDAQLFGEGPVAPDEPATWQEYLARLPVSYLDVGRDPFGVWRPSRLMIGARTDGRTPTGDTTSHGPIVVTGNPHCTTADRAAGTCTLHSGYGVMSGVLSTLDSFRAANGVRDSSSWYAALSVALGGGLGGGERATGDNLRLVMNHELGHGWGFPHWAAEHVDYPYEGVQRARGGVGDTWAVDQRDGSLFGPRCGTVERQSPMQRAQSCMPAGMTLDPYSDYESARISRRLFGATEQTGEVAYLGGNQSGPTRPYRLPAEDGRVSMAWSPTGPGFVGERFDQASGAWVADVDDGWAAVTASEVPVVMFYGAATITGGFVEAPIEYVGNVLGALDPAVPADFDQLYARRSSDFYWAHDVAFRFTLDDGTVLHRLYAPSAKLRAGDPAPAWFAVNLPADLGRRVTRCEVLSRPLGHYDPASRLTAADSAATYFASATVVATYVRP